MTTQAISDQVQTVDIFGGVVEAYRLEGFDQGYRRAAHDLLGSLVFNAEEFLREHPDRVQELRKVLYAFVERLERQLDRDADRRGSFEGGLGI